MNERVSALNATDVVFHRVSLYISKIGFALLEQRGDQSQNNVGWNIERKRIEGRWVEGQVGEFRLTFDPIDYELKWENRSRQLVDRIGLKNTSIADVDHWWLTSTHAICGVELHEFNFSNHTRDIHFGFDVFPILHRQAILDWIQLRSRGERALLQLNNLFTETVRVRIWPNNFHSEITGQVDEFLSLKGGIALADDLNRSPYLYLNGYIANQPKALPKIEASFGHWLQGSPSGYIIPFEEYLNAPFQQIVDSILNAADQIVNS
ncbi:hypothetical protein [Phaeocystidibacter marisrubri]|uniref:Uncharacterized protein n=1 Tax=Phaeocystidibacter marisrubri TaxID=1577780 RepID=A0A6L3ZDH1_9FLAO|nr:hypothetical protein [Phaeocystidibacter marisrubri]KAB2815263.1 hypothetical protein F8C82_14320 [Phaeocystidibacter marisrubri]GGH71192.1 hypothetical protein GCM10011318_13960 [Phaeocystidibacter marisrubri]